MGLKLTHINVIDTFCCIGGPPRPSNNYGCNGTDVTSTGISCVEKGAAFTVQYNTYKSQFSIRIMALQDYQLNTFTPCAAFWQHVFYSM